MQEGFSSEKWDKSYDRAGSHTEAGTKGGSPNPPSENSQKYEFQDSAEQGHKNIYKKTSPYVSAYPEVIVHSKKNGGKRRAESINSEILYGMPRKITVSPHKSYKERGGKIKNSAYNNAR